MIVSISRRCDIPRFQFDRFLEQLDAGFACAVNPFNPSQVRRISLEPSEAILVFWTRDPRPILAHGKSLEDRGYRFYVMTTLTGYPPLLEPNMPPREAVIEALQGLAALIGPQRVIWRYDPILLCSLTDGDFHRRNFAALLASLRDRICRIILSVYDPYRGAERRFARLEAAENFRLYPHYTKEGRLTPEIRELLAQLAGLARDAGAPLYTCAEAEDLSSLGILHGACIDPLLIHDLWGVEGAGKDKNQRPFCGCAPSVDIGRYGQCPGGCVYCYAQRGTPGRNGEVTPDRA